MKRRLLTILLFLLLGVLVNLAVAWACALWVSGLEGAPSIAGTYTSQWEWGVERCRSAGAITIVSCGGDRQHFASVGALRAEEDDIEPSSLIPAWCRVSPPPEEGWEFWLVEGRGWPLVSMWWKGRINMSSAAFEDVHGAIPTTLRYPGLLGEISALKAHLPLRPIWPGFVVNTIFYAVVLWLAVRGPFVLRRIIRRTRGRCTMCAYPIGASPVCTECGRAVRPRTMPR